jgi:hypothetical protein
VAREKRHGVTDTGAEVEGPACGRPVTLELGRDVRDLVLREILGILARQRDVGRMEIAVLIGELVELCLVHDFVRRPYKK